MAVSLQWRQNTATPTISQYDRERGRMTLATVCRNQEGEEVLTGEAEIRYRPESETGQARIWPSRPASRAA